MPFSFAIPEAALRPFYEERVAVRGAREGGAFVRGTFAACVLDGGLDGALTTLGSNVERASISVMIPKSGEAAWRERSAPRVGDELRYKGARFLVQAVAESETEFTLEARES